jgi:ADP-heptose:LPS heptosyltransferase
VALTVLALRALGLGDALTAVPALRGLRRAFPGARLVLAGPPDVGGWLRDLGLADEVLPAVGRPALHRALPRALPWPQLRPPPDVAVNLHGRGPQSHRLLATLGARRMVAFASPEAPFHAGPAWRADEHEVDRWCRLVQSVGGACGRADLLLATDGVLASSSVAHPAAAIVHPGAGAPARRWPVERWAKVVAALRARGWRVLVSGVPSEAETCAQVAAAGAADLCGRLDVPDFARAVATAGVVISGDTGVAHLATALRRPSVLLFGPTSPDRWGPAVDEELHQVLWHPEVPSPADPQASTLDPRLAAISVKDVLDALDALDAPGAPEGLAPLAGEMPRPSVTP